MSTRVLILALAIVASVTALAIDNVLTGPQLLQLFESIGGIGAGAGITHLFHLNLGATTTGPAPDTLPEPPAVIPAESAPIGGAASVAQPG